MKLPYFLIVIWAALPLAAMEQEFRFLPDGAGWFVHGNYPTEVPIRYWFQPGSDGRAMRIRAEWNRHENSIICPADNAVFVPVKNTPSPAAGAPSPEANDSGFQPVFSTTCLEDGKN